MQLFGTEEAKVEEDSRPYAGGQPMPPPLLLAGISGGVDATEVPPLDADDAPDVPPPPRPSSASSERMRAWAAASSAVSSVTRASSVVVYSRARSREAAADSLLRSLRSLACTT